MKDRIKRVINNHQLSCEHLSKYFYILRGFKPILNQVEVPVSPFDKSMPITKNRYILEEDLSTISEADFEGFDVWTITFNFFDNKLLNAEGNLIDISELKLPVRYKNLNIFNADNPLMGVTDNHNMTNEDRLAYIKQIGILK